MYAIGFEGISDASREAINGICPQMNRVLKKAANFAGGNLRTRWFGASGNKPSLAKKFREMDYYINERCVRLTFVRKSVGQKVDCAEVEANDFAQVMTLPGGERFIPSGARIYILPSFDGQSPIEKFNTVCHELSHRVLGTTDYPGGNCVYGKDDALQLAVNDGVLAVTCAENWGYFYAELKTSLP